MQSSFERRIVLSNHKSDICQSFLDPLAHAVILEAPAAHAHREFATQEGYQIFDMRLREHDAR